MASVKLTAGSGDLNKMASVKLTAGSGDLNKMASVKLRAIWRFKQNGVCEAERNLAI
jgi:hypothetical protein